MQVPASIAPLQANTDERMPVSERIRQRLVDAGQRYHANDNIAAFVHEGEREALRHEVEARFEDVLRALVIDTGHDHNTAQTARRVAKMFVDEVFRGRYVPAPEVTCFPNTSRLGELMTVGPIRVRSACSHHFCPIMGHVWIGVLPHQDAALIGLSKEALMEFSTGVMARGWHAGCAVWRRAGWWPGQATRCSLRAIRVSPMPAKSTRWARPVCPPSCVARPRQATSLPSPVRLVWRTDRTSDACAGFHQSFPNARICEWVMARPQIQEEAVVMLADELERRMRPDGLAVVMQADHFCTHWRGIKDDGTRMRNTVMRGLFSRDAALRGEFLALVGRDDA